MDWSTFNRVQLHRLRQRLSRHRSFYLEVHLFLKKYGFSPDDPLVRGTVLSLRQVEDFLAVVDLLIRETAPYRPLVDPWKNQGLAASLRPDFKARGIDGKEPPRP